MRPKYIIKMDEKTPKKALKKKRVKSTPQVAASESDDSDHEQPDHNGIDNSLHLDDSLSSDGGWNSDDDRELVQKVKSTSKQNDKVSYKTRLKQLDWSKIAFKSYSATDCEDRFQNHLKNVRRYRNLSEIATDIETNINKCPIKKPLNSYQLFIQDQLTQVKSSGDFSETMKNLGSLYKELSSEERSVYERKAIQLRLEYKQMKEEFNSGNISKFVKPTATPVNKVKTPFMIYAESMKSEESDYAKLRENYANLSRDEKYKWVIKAVSEAQDGSDSSVSKILTKEEQRIFKGQIKTTPSAYSLYVKETYAKIKDKLEEAHDSKNVFTEIALQWKLLDPKKKKLYTDAALILKEKAIEEQEAFNERHGVTPQKVKRRKSTYVERQPDDDDDLDHEETVVEPKQKKRKISLSNSNHTDSDETNAKQIQQNSPAKFSPSKSNAVQSPVKKIPLEQSPAKEITLGKSPAKGVIEGKKKKLNMESSENDGSDHRSESDATDSNSASSKKKSKKEKKEKKSIVEPPGEKPPSDIITYFAKYIHTGKTRKAQKAFDKLTKKERKHIKSEYNEIVESYVKRLKAYIASLPKEEAVAYIAKVKETDDAEKSITEEKSTADEASSQEE